MVGDNNTTPDPTFYQAIFDKWYALGSVDTMGVAWNRDGLGPGVHSWGSGGVFQDTVSAYGIGGIFLKNGTSTAWGVFGGIYQTYLAWGGPSADLGWPISDYYWQDSRWLRNDFQNGYICADSWNGWQTYVLFWQYEVWCPP